MTKNPQNCYNVIVPNSDTLIVSFAGHDKMFYGIPRFEFVKILEKHFPHISRYFYVDTNLKCYLQGIPGITETVEETVEYLKQVIAPYKHVVFLGTSSGGYAATLFGSLLQVHCIVAFTPVTILKKVSRPENEKWRDIDPYINNTTIYYIFGDESIKDPEHYHHISQCERITKRPIKLLDTTLEPENKAEKIREKERENVKLVRMNVVDLKQMRDKGMLYRILWTAIQIPEQITTGGVDTA
jgi:hypothetical protein